MAKKTFKMKTKDRSDRLSEFQRGEIRCIDFLEPEWMRYFISIRRRFIRLGLCKDVAESRTSDTMLKSVEYFDKRRDELANHPCPEKLFLWKCGRMMLDVNRRERGESSKLVAMDNSIEAVAWVRECPGADLDLIVQMAQISKEVSPGEYSLLVLDLDGVPDLEIAKKCGISLGTVRSRRSKLRRLFRERLRQTMKNAADPLDLYA